MTTKKGSLKQLFALLVLTVFAAGIGVGSLLGLQSDDAMTAAATQTTTHRGLNFDKVLAEPSINSERVLKPKAQPSEFKGPEERVSPYDWIAESQIDMRADGVFIKMNNPQWAIFADTNSMDPVFDAGSHAIQILPTKKEDVHVGDILSYESPMGFSIIHRVIEIGQDEEGWYCITKGDNNPSPDPWKIRFHQVRRITVALIY